MAEANDEVFSILNPLIRICRDGEDGFRAAAEAVKGARLKSVFLDYSEQRAKFANELQFLIAKLGGRPGNAGSLAAVAHRGWMSVRTAMTGRDENAVIAECVRGEEAALHAYDKALSREMPAEVRALIQRQRERVSEACRRVCSLAVELDDSISSPGVDRR